MRGAAQPGLLALLVATSMAGCSGAASEGDFHMQAAGNARHGVQVIEQAGCGACHLVPGVRGARGRLAPPLTAFAERAWIGGEIPNTPENLERWIENPRALIPATAMPALGVREADARDAAAYLFTLH